MKLKPKVIVLHGWSLKQSTRDNWQGLIELLSQAGYEVLYLPLPGLDSPLEKPWTLNHYQDYVISSLKTDEPVVLLGHSFGGQLSVRVAASGKLNLKALVLIGPAGVIDQRLSKKIKRWVFKQVALIGQKVFPHGQVADRLKRVLYKLAREKDYLEAQDALKKTMSAVLSDEIVSDLEAVKVPTLLLWGQKDQATPIQLAQIFQDKLATRQLVVFPNENHCPHYHQPQKISQLIINFLAHYGF